MNPAGKRALLALVGWGWGSSKQFWWPIASPAEGLVNLVKESRVYREGNVGSLKCLMQEEADRFVLKKNYSVFRVEIRLGEGISAGKGAMELTKYLEHLESPGFGH